MKHGSNLSGKILPARVSSAWKSTPWKPDHNPGASSNGNAALIGLGIVDLAIGGDQGGSVRIPASWSGCFGLKPTYGLVPYTGCASIDATIDHIGPMASSTEGLAKLLQVISGYDRDDPRQQGRIGPDFKADYLSALSGDLQGIKIGVLHEGFEQDNSDLGILSSEDVVDDCVRSAIARLRSLGAHVEDVSIPLHLDAYHMWSAIGLEGSADFMLRGNGVGTNWQGWYNTGLADAMAKGMKTRPRDMSATVKSVVLRGEFMRKFYNNRYYGKAQNQRSMVADAYDAILRDFDMIAMPTTPHRATKMVPRDAGPLATVTNALDVLRNTVVADLTGHPAISIPCGLRDGLPVGLMLVGRHFQDAKLLIASQVFESHEDWRRI